MYGFFKFLLILGVVAGIAGFVLPQVGDHPAVVKANLPVEAPQWLSYGGLALIVIGLAGRMATRPSESEKTAEWK
jgi:hypothetical protein